MEGHSPKGTGTGMELVSKETAPIPKGMAPGMAQFQTKRPQGQQGQPDPKGSGPNSKGFPVYPNPTGIPPWISWSPQSHRNPPWISGTPQYQRISQIPQSHRNPPWDSGTPQPHRIAWIPQSHRICQFPNPTGIPIPLPACPEPQDTAPPPQPPQTPDFLPGSQLPGDHLWGGFGRDLAGIRGRGAPEGGDGVLNAARLHRALLGQPPVQVLLQRQLQV